MTPLHIFRRRGECFAYHAGAGRFVRTTPGAHALLEKRLAMPAAEADDAFRREWPEADGVVSDVAALEAEGFFEPVDSPAESDEEFERTLDRHFSSPSNSLTLSVSSGCNLACRYCYLGVCRDQLPEKGLMPQDVADRALDLLFASSDQKKNLRVMFFGGEPLLAKQVIFRSVERCRAEAARRSVRAEFSTTTNATLVDDETAALLAGGDFGVMVSLDGPKDLHDAQCPARDGGGSYDRAVAGIRKLLALRSDVTVRCTMAHPPPDPMRLVRFLSDFGFRSIVLGTVRNPAFPSPLDFTEADDEAFDAALEREVLPWMVAERAAGRRPAYDPYEDIASFQSEAEHPERVTSIRCGACRGTCAVAPDGTMYPCHRFVGMEPWALGHVADGLPSDRGRGFWRAWREAVMDHCRECWAFRICGGPCPWEIARRDGTFDAPSPRHCREIKAWIEQGAYYIFKTGESGRGKQGKGRQ